MLEPILALEEVRSSAPTAESPSQSSDSASRGPGTVGAVGPAGPAGGFVVCDSAMMYST
jgi:hypothetical protein